MLGKFPGKMAAAGLGSFVTARMFHGGESDVGSHTSAGYPSMTGLPPM